MSEIAEFFRALYGTELPAGNQLLLWTLPDKTSHWARNIEEAERTVVRVRETAENVYYGVGLSGKNYGPGKRCLATEVTAIPGVWMDFDLKGSAHRKANLPESHEQVIELVTAGGLPPTLGVHTGNGLHLYWLFQEPLLIRDAEGYQAASRLVRRWNNTMRVLARSRGWDVDATHDLARVLRVPGTVNRKVAGAHRPVSIVHYQKLQRFEPHHFEERFLDDDANAPDPRRRRGKGFHEPIEDGDLRLEPNACVDAELHDLLCDVEPRFKASWERKRRDLQDQSQSAYDISLATFAALAGWTDQEISNLIIHHRRKHGQEPKLRLDYHRATIRKARLAVDKQTATEALGEMTVVGETRAIDAPDGSDEDQNREKRLKLLSGVFGIGIQRIVKYLTSPPQYRLETVRGSIMLGGVDGLLKQDKLRMAIAASSGWYIPKFKPADWDLHGQALLDACVEEYLGDEATDEGQMRSWLGIYLAENRPSPSCTEEAVVSLNPFVDDSGRVVVFLAGLKTWLNVRFGERLTAKAISPLLKNIGCESWVLNCTLGGTKTTRSTWILPREFGQDRIPESTPGFALEAREETAA